MKILKVYISELTKTMINILPYNSERMIGVPGLTGWVMIDWS